MRRSAARGRRAGPAARRRGRPNSQEAFRRTGAHPGLAAGRLPNGGRVAGGASPNGCRRCWNRARSNIPAASRASAAKSSIGSNPAWTARNSNRPSPNCANSNSARCCASPRAIWPAWAARWKSPAKSPTWPMPAWTPCCAFACSRWRGVWAGPSMPPPTAAGRPRGFCVLGLGKLGGQELNYSSDVDVIFLYSEEGHVFKARRVRGEQTGKSMASHEFFTRLAESMIAEITRLTAQGALYRMDLRLAPGRPGRPAGPLPGQFRDLLRAMGPDLGADDAHQGPPRGRRRGIGRGIPGNDPALSLSPLVGGGHLPRCHRHEIPHRERSRQTGRTGAQRQVGPRRHPRSRVHRRRPCNSSTPAACPFLQGGATVPTLEKLASYRLLSPPRTPKRWPRPTSFCATWSIACKWKPASKPTPSPPRARPANVWPVSWDLTPCPLLSPRARPTPGQSAGLYEKISRRGRTRRNVRAARRLRRRSGRGRNSWRGHHFRDADRALRMVEMFVNGPGYVHVSRPHAPNWRASCSRKFFALCPPHRPRPPPPAAPLRSRPGDGAAAKLHGGLRRARHALRTVDARSPPFLSCCCCSLTVPNSWPSGPSAPPTWWTNWKPAAGCAGQKTAGETLHDLRYGLEDKDQFRWLRRYHEAELMRIGLRDILGLADFEQNLLGAFRPGRRLPAIRAGSGLPRARAWRPPPFCIIGLGKLGGAEVGYGSDLDVLFVAPSGTKNLPACQRLAAGGHGFALPPHRAWDLFFVLTRGCVPTARRACWSTPLEACEDYYRRRAALWEIQALTRARPIAGDMALGAQFQQLAAALANFTPQNVAAGFVSAFLRRRQTAVGPRRLHPGLEGGNRADAPAHHPGAHRRRAGTIWPSRRERAG